MSSYVRHPGMILFLSSASLILLAAEMGGQERPPTTSTAPATAPSTSTAPAEPKKIPLSFNNAPIQQIAKFLSDNLGKPVIPNKDIMQVKISVINTEPLPLDEALHILTAALHENGVAIEERKRTIHLIPISQIIQRQIKMVPPDVDLATIKPSNQIVRKVFDVRQYDPTKLVEVLRPLMPSYGHITADATTSKLIVVATAEELITMAQVIAELDRTHVSGRELRVFPIKNCDVYEIVPVLEKLIAGYLGVEVKAPTVTAGPTAGPPPGRPPGGGGAPPGAPGAQGPPGGKPPATVGILSIQAEEKPVLLIPDPRRSSIVVEASPHVLEQIAEWLKHLDQPKPPTTQTEIVEIQYGDAADLCTQLTNMLNNIPDESLRSALRIFPFPSSRRLMIVGSEQNRNILKEWLKDIDTEDTGLRVTQTFTLKYADAQQIAENIKEVFQEQAQRGFFYYSGREPVSDRTKVTVTANVRNNSVTVLASPERMARIADQIAEWDRPFEGEEAAPRIFTLRYADPEKAKELLESLFTKKEESTRPWYFWDESEERAPSPVGRLFGQFRFEAYPEMGKLIVVSKSEENYGVIEQMIEQIDQPQLAGLPRIIELKFAEAETLAEQLNALLNAPGTPTSVLRRGQAGTFKDLRDEGSPYSTRRDQGPQRQPQPQEQSELSVMRFWWQNSPADTKIKQPSNLVGKLRIVPNVEQNLLLVAAPEEYADAIEEFVKKLDKPGYQVLIKAVIAEITHDDSTSLGFRFSTDPSVFTTGDDPLITENALRGLLTYTFEDTYGRPHTLSLDLDVNNLLSLLRRVTDLKIRSEPKILTADNVEGEFFDGQDIPFISDTQRTETGLQNQGFDYFPVGITLRVRPHITKEATIDLMVNLRISNVIPGQTLFGGAIVNRRETTTRVVLENGKTFMISGILRQEQREIIRRIPGLGDIPILGELFTHRELADVNSELLIFLTPYVIGPDLNRDAIESEPLERLKNQMMPEVGVDQRGAPAREPDEGARTSAASDTSVRPVK